MRVCLVTHRFGGYHGCAMEAAKWAAAFASLGWSVTRAAGVFDDHLPGDVVVRGMWADRPGGEPPPVDHDTIRHLCAAHDLVVLDNAGTLFSAPIAARAWEEHALAAGTPVVLRHHDPPWQGAPLRPVTDGAVPLHDPRHLHVLINDHTRREFSARWPELAAADALRVVRNRIDVATLRGGDREGTRSALAVRPAEFLVAHPARADGPSKNIPGAVEFVRDLAGRLGQPLRYWLTDDLAEPPAAVATALSTAPGLVRGRAARQADLYAAADLVLLSSVWEGWGLPVVEAAAARKLAVAGPYPVLTEIRSLGVTVLDLADTAGVAELLSNTEHLDALLDANEAAVRATLAPHDLPATLACLAERAGELLAGRSGRAGAQGRSAPDDRTRAASNDVHICDQDRSKTEWVPIRRHTTCASPGRTSDP